MDYRMLELIVPSDTLDEAREASEGNNILGVWTEEIGEERSKLRILVDAAKSETVSDTLSSRFSNTDGFRIMLFEVEATLPLPNDREEKIGENTLSEESNEEAESTSFSGRISREELYADISSGSQLTIVYVGMVILSTVVACVGLIRSDVAIIIGAMVIAPLLAPNVSMALSATLGDMDLGWKAVKTNAAGLVASLSVALIMGMLITIDPGTDQLITRSTVTLSDIIIALAAGSAGVLAFTGGMPAAIIGVMVAVALLPPLATFGLFLGSGYISLAIGAMVLTVTNLICINLAGVLTFLLQGIRPRDWWEAEKAKKASRYAIITWLILLAIFAYIIWSLEGSG